MKRCTKCGTYTSSRYYCETCGQPFSKGKQSRKKRAFLIGLALFTAVGIANNQDTKAEVSAVPAQSVVASSYTNAQPQPAESAPQTKTASAPAAGQDTITLYSQLVQSGFLGVYTYEAACCPAMAFNADGRYTFRVNYTDEMLTVTGSYRVHRDASSNPVIVCDLSGYGFGGDQFILTCGAGGVWVFEGPNMGFTTSGSSFTQGGELIQAPITEKQARSMEAWEGIWQTVPVNGNYPEEELIIHQASNGQVSFELNIYRIAGFTGQTATMLPDGRAVFSDPNGLQGEMRFTQEGVVLDLTGSSNPYVGAQTLLFSVRASQRAL